MVIGMKKIFLVFIGFLCVVGFGVSCVSASWDTPYQNGWYQAYGDTDPDKVAGPFEYWDTLYLGYDGYNNIHSGICADSEGNTYGVYGGAVRSYTKNLDVRWTTSTGTGSDNSVTLYGGRVYAPGSAGKMYCLNADTGAVIWTRSAIATYPAGWTSYHTITSFGSNVVIDADGNAIATSRTNIIGSYNGGETVQIAFLHVFSVSPEGNTNWDVMEVGDNAGSPISLVTADGFVYVKNGTGLNKISAVNGNLVGHVSDPLGSSGALSHLIYMNGICVVTVPGGLYAFDTDTLGIVWTNTVDTDVWSYNRDDGWLYISNHRYNPVSGIMDVGYEIEGLYVGTYEKMQVVTGTGDHMYWVRDKTVGINDLVTGDNIAQITKSWTWPISGPFALLDDGSLVMCCGRYLYACPSKTPDITIDSLDISPPYLTSLGAIEYSAVLGGLDSVPTVLTWNFGDGSTSNYLAGTHLYTEYGLYALTLHVENQYGIYDDVTRSVSVRPLDTRYSLADTAWPVVRHDLENTGQSNTEFISTGVIETVYAGNAPYYNDPTYHYSPNCLNVVSGDDELLYTPYGSDFTMLKISPDGDGLTSAWPFGDFYSWFESAPEGTAPCVVDTPYGEGVIGVALPFYDSIVMYGVETIQSSVLWLGTETGVEWATVLQDQIIVRSPVILPNGIGCVMYVGDSPGFILFDPSDGTILDNVGINADGVMQTFAYGDNKLYFSSETDLYCYSIDDAEWAFVTSFDVLVKFPDSNERGMPLSGPILDKDTGTIYIVLGVDSGIAEFPFGYIVLVYDANDGQYISGDYVDTSLNIGHWSWIYGTDNLEDSYNSYVSYDKINEALCIGLFSGLCRYDLNTNSQTWEHAYVNAVTNEVDLNWTDLELTADYYEEHVYGSGFVQDSLGNVFVTTVSSIFVYRDDIGYNEYSVSSACGFDAAGESIFCYNFGINEAMSMYDSITPVILSDGSVVFAGGTRDQDEIPMAAMAGFPTLYIITAFSSWGPTPSCPTCDPNYVSPDHIDKYPGWEGITTLPWSAIDGDEVTFNGQVEWGEYEPTDLWFSVGSKSNSYGYKTKYPITAIEGGNFSYHQLGYPLVSNETFFFRAGCEYGYGQEIKCTVMERPAYNQTDLGTTESQRFTHSYHDNGANIIEDIVTSVNNPYVMIFGPYFVVLVFGAILVNLAMRGNSLILPGLLVLLCGGTLYRFLPPEGMMFAQMFMIMGLTGIIYWLFTRNR